MTLAELFEGLTPDTLTDAAATTIYEALAVACKARHEAEEVRGRLAMQGFCVCGHSSIGNGGVLCAQLRALRENAEPAPWLAAASALRAALETP